MANILTSWKEIASYLGKGVRTVQRWETHLALPIRRPDSAARNVVFAVPSELDAWVLSAPFRETTEDIEDAATLRTRIEQLQMENAALRRQISRHLMQSAELERQDTGRNAPASALDLERRSTE